MYIYYVAYRPILYFRILDRIVDKQKLRMKNLTYGDNSLLFRETWDKTANVFILKNNCGDK